jgi:hypothetical protein
VIFFQANKRKRASRSKPSKKSKNDHLNSTPSNEVSEETKAKLAVFPSDEVNLMPNSCHSFISADVISCSETCASFLILFAIIWSGHWKEKVQ